MFEDKKIVVKKQHFEGITFTSYEVDNNLRKPLLFFFHGFDCHRDVGITDKGEIFALKGFYVISIDSHLHGDRTTQLFSSLSNSDRQLEIFNIEIKTAKEAKYLFKKYFSKMPNVIDNAVFAYGISMGAGTAFYFTTIMDELKAMVSIVGSPSFYGFYQHKKEVYSFKDDFYYQTNLNYLKEECPLLNYKRLLNKNIFMSVGTKDNIVPLRFAKELSKYLDSNIAIYKEYDTEHVSTKEMLEDSYSFLEKHLKEVLNKE